MRVAFPMRVDALDKPGGDLVLVREYIAGGSGAYNGGRVMYTGEILTDLKGGLGSFDLVHLTNLDRPYETYAAYHAAKAAGKKIVFSTIHHSYREISAYERQGRTSPLSPLLGRIGFGGVELLRTLVRSRRYPQLLKMVASTLALGVRGVQAEMLLGCDRALVNGPKEQADILSDCPGAEASRFVHLTNGLPVQEALSEVPRDIDVAVVGRIEARKNQINILQALEELGVSGVFLGAENVNHPGYCKRFKELIATSRSQYRSSVPREEALQIMRRAKVHVSASWFEVLSLVDLEAYSLGCRVVSSRCGGTRDVLGDQAVYVEPSDRSQIAAAIAVQLQAAQTQQAGAPRLRLPTWGEIAEQLAGIYAEVLSS